jgi:putative PIN family toxin of toxin-antitoxin system
VQKEELGKTLGNLRTVLDTNVFVSAFLSREGLAAKIVSLALQGKLRACYNQAIIDEYDEVLSRPKFNFKLTQKQMMTCPTLTAVT